MAEKETMLEKIKRVMGERDHIRNMGVIAHIDHGKTTCCDSLLAGAGMISIERAGEQCYTDTKEVEQERGITVASADVNMVHRVKDTDFLINLIDTPGHVDFGGDVTRALRVVDGALVLSDAAEGVMPQTETVLKQALKENVKPVLFINKVDRLIFEMRMTPEKMQEQLLSVISNVNKLISQLAAPEYKDKWQVNVQEGSVCFGSAKDKWALSFPLMKEKGISFKEVIDAYTAGKEAVEEFSKKAPLHEPVLDMVVKHLPSPLEAQKYRIPVIWTGDRESKAGQALLNCDPKGPVIVGISKVHLYGKSEISIARVFSGTLKLGQELYTPKGTPVRAAQLYAMKGQKKEMVESVPAGNIIGIQGFRDVGSGGTATSEKDIEPFTDIKHMFDAVVTKSIEAINPKDLNKLVEALRKKKMEDPTLKVEINEETGEHLISGLGELHLEIIEDDIKREIGIDVKTSPPIVVYRESITKESPEVEGKSPNKHNKFLMTVEPLPEKMRLALAEGKIQERKLKKKDEDLWKQLVEEGGFTRDEAKDVREVYGQCLLEDNTKGIVHIGEVIELVLQAFREVVDQGPLAREPCIGVRVSLNDTTLHEDAIHRGPAQVVPAVRDAIKDAMLQAGPVLYEPVQTIRIDAPVDFMGGVTKIVSSRRGQLLDIQQDEASMVAKAKLPVAEMFGFTDVLRSETEGRAFWFLQDSTFEKLPPSLQDNVVRNIRSRKGLAETQR